MVTGGGGGGEGSGAGQAKAGRWSKLARALREAQKPGLDATKGTTASPCCAVDSCPSQRFCARGYRLR